ncbi:MAG: hypothetical protein GY909_00815 [Oligoflexia bacterium]|nr:hypothetical protein [Oligoflexia bacterium]
MKRISACFIFTLALTFSVQASFLVGVGTDKKRDYSKNPVISKRDFFRLLENFEKQFTPLALTYGDKLHVLGGWNDPTADMAMSRRWGNDAQILVYRGMAHRKELSKKGLLLILCHELGHLYGGTPHTTMGKSVEGQADYWATNICLPQVLPNDDHMIAINEVAHFLANNWDEPIPNEQTPDLTIVDETLKVHPAPQCRFDTYLAGLRKQPRPRCWFAN